MAVSKCCQAHGIGIHRDLMSVLTARPAHPGQPLGVTADAVYMQSLDMAAQQKQGLAGGTWFAHTLHAGSKGGGLANPRVQERFLKGTVLVAWCDKAGRCAGLGAAPGCQARGASRPQPAATLPPALHAPVWYVLCSSTLPVASSTRATLAQVCGQGGEEAGCGTRRDHRPDECSPCHCRSLRQLQAP